MMYFRTKRESEFLIDKILSPLAVIAPFFTLPQLYEVWILKRVAGVSSLSWFLMGLMSVLWFWHAVKHKDRILMANTLLMVLFNFAISIGVIIFN